MKLVFPTENKYVYWREVTIDIANRNPYELRYDYNRGVRFWDISDEEFVNLTTPLSKILNNDVVDNDILYFEKSTTFPKLFLGACGAPLKRTIKASKATKVVVNDDVIDKILSIVGSKKVWLIREYIDPEDKYLTPAIYYVREQTLLSNNKTIDDVLAYLRGIGVNISDYTLYRTFDRHFDENNVSEILANGKVVGISKLNKYLNTKLPALDEETKETLLSMFKSTDVEQQKLAVDMLKTCSTANVLIDLYEHIGGYSVSNLNTSVKNSVAFKYILELGGLSISDLRHWNREFDHILRKMADLYHSDIIDNDQKTKLWKHFSTVIVGDENGPHTKHQKEQFGKFNMPRKI